MSPSQSGSALSAYGINLIDEDNTGCGLFRFCKQVTHTAGTYPDKHFYKLRSRDVEERGVCLAGNGASEKSFTGSGRPHQQNTFRDLCSDIRKLFWMLQKVDEFRDFFFYLFCTGNIFKGDLIFLGRHLAGA